MTRPTILDLDLVVVPREAAQVMLDEVTAADQHEPFSDKTMSGIFDAMLSASPYPTAWDDVRKYVEWLEEEVGRLEDENSELRYEPWPEWARAVLKVIRSHTGYDGYDDATDGVDMPLELSEHLSQVESDTDRWKARAESAEVRIAELEAELASLAELYGDEEKPRYTTRRLRMEVERAKAAADIRIAELEKEKHAALTMIAMLEKRLADSEKIVKCMVDWENGMAPLREDFRAARAYMEGK